jgi:hypothetical protein
MVGWSKRAKIASIAAASTPGCAEATPKKSRVAALMSAEQQLR